MSYFRAYYPCLLNMTVPGCVDVGLLDMAEVPAVVTVGTAEVVT